MLLRRNHIICIAALLSSLRDYTTHAQDDEAFNTTAVIIASNSDNDDHLTMQQLHRTTAIIIPIIIISRHRYSMHLIKSPLIMRQITSV